jgi:phenylalanyl-tRNA synthetase beta chain
LKITQVSIGTKQLQIVCGATNVAIGQKVAVALVGTTLYPSPDNPLTIKEAKIRGEESFGMLCAEDELGIGNSHDGILILGKDAPIGAPINEVIKLHPDFEFECPKTS